MATDAPTADTRIVTLDVVRGIAVMGILSMNIAAFAMPAPAYANPAAFGGNGFLDLASWAVNFVLFDGKMRGLFSILFGASTLLVIQRAQAGGRSGARAHYARMVVLLLFGLAHFYFIWWGDILALYAECGLLLYFFRDLTPRAMIRWAVGLMSLSMIFFGMIAWTASLGGTTRVSPEASRELMAARDTVEQEVGAKSRKIASELKLYRSDYATIAGDRLYNRTLEPVGAIIGFGFETLALMLIGMALFKTGFLTGDWTPQQYRRWAVRAGLVAIPILTFLAWWQYSANFDSIRVFAAFLALTPPLDTWMATAWAALIILWLKYGPMPALKERVAATGRMAFTNYLATSIVMTTIFYGYGLALFGTVSRFGMWPFVIGMWAAMLIWSKPWLDRFHYGPLEWLWRSLSRASLQPLRR